MNTIQVSRWITFLSNNGSFMVNFTKLQKQMFSEFYAIVHKMQLFELSENLCTIMHTMNKNNCVNFSNNSDNLVLWRFNV